jgi:tetratricopeptide (TPR) repeat protein
LARDADRQTCASESAPSDQCAAACTRVLASGAPISATGRAFVLKNRGNAYSSKDEYGKAILDYGEAIRQKPDYAYAFFIRGNAYGDRGEYDRVISDYNEALAVERDDLTYVVASCLSRLP